MRNENPSTGQSAVSPLSEIPQWSTAEELQARRDRPQTVEAALAEIIETLRAVNRAGAEFNAHDAPTSVLLDHMLLLLRSIGTIADCAGIANSAHLIEQQSFRAMENYLGCVNEMLDVIDAKFSTPDGMLLDTITLSRDELRTNWPSVGLTTLMQRKQSNYQLQ